MYYFIVDSNGNLIDISPSYKTMTQIRRAAYLYLKKNMVQCKLYRSGQNKSKFIGEAGWAYENGKSHITWMGSAKGSYLYDLNSDGTFGDRYLNRR